MDMYCMKSIISISLSSSDWIQDKEMSSLKDHIQQTQTEPSSFPCLTRKACSYWWRNKTQGSEGIPISAVYISAHVATWAKEHPVTGPSACDKHKPRATSTTDSSELPCSLSVATDNYHSLYCWPLGRGIQILNCQALSDSDAFNDLCTHQNVLNALVFFKKPTLGISDHSKQSRSFKGPPWFQCSNTRQMYKIISPIQLNNYTILRVWLM